LKTRLYLILSPQQQGEEVKALCISRNSLVFKSEVSSNNAWLNLSMTWEWEFITVVVQHMTIDEGDLSMTGPIDDLITVLSLVLLCAWIVNRKWPSMHEWARLGLRSSLI
jgi:hypothetical protein